MNDGTNKTANQLNIDDYEILKKEIPTGKKNCGKRHDSTGLYS